MKSSRSESFSERYLASWREREIDKDGTLKPFSKKELEMTYDIDDCDETLQKLIELSWESHFQILHLDSDMTQEKQEALATETKELYNNEQAGIGRLWNELWYKHHISLSWAFGHFFNHLSLFTIEDMMKLKPENFTSGVKITL